MLLIGPVKKRFKLFIHKSRTMIALENGEVLFQKKNGTIESKLKLDQSYKIEIAKHNKFTIKDKKGGTKTILSDDAGVWVCILNTLKNQTKL